MFKIQDISRAILEEVRPSIEACGFTLNKQKRMFSRTSGDCIQSIDLHFYRSGHSIHIKPTVLIKIKSIEEVYRSVSNISGRPYFTIGNHLLQIMQYVEDGVEIEESSPIYDWLVEDMSHVKKLIEIIPSYFEEVALPYFDENSSVSRVDYLLNKFPREISIHQSLYPLRVNLAVIAAQLNKNPQYEDLIQVYGEEMTEAEESYLKEFEKLVRGNLI